MNDNPLLSERDNAMAFFGWEQAQREDTYSAAAPADVEYQDENLVAALQDLHDSTLRILDELNIDDDAFEDDGWADLACNRISTLRRRIAELEATVNVRTGQLDYHRRAVLEPGKVRTQWGVRYGADDVANWYEDERGAREAAADPAGPGVPVRREIRTGPWTNVDTSTSGDPA